MSAPQDQLQLDPKAKKRTLPPRATRPMSHTRHSNYRVWKRNRATRTSTRYTTTTTTTNMVHTLRQIIYLDITGTEVESTKQHILCLECYECGYYEIAGLYTRPGEGARPTFTQEFAVRIIRQNPLGIFRPRKRKGINKEWEEMLLNQHL